MSFITGLHAVVRWVLLIAAALVVLKALIGWLGKGPYTALDDRLGMLYVSILDIQLLTGLLIWLFGATGLRALPQAMGNPGLRFLALEHPILAILALAVAHIGRDRAKRGGGADRHRSTVLFYLVSLLLLALIFLLPMMLG